MNRFVVLTLALALGVIATAGAAPTRFVPVKRIHRDCADGRLTGTYPLPALRRALRHLPPDVRRYTHCPSQLQRAINRRTPGRFVPVRRAIRDCADGHLTRRYSRPTLRRTLRHLPQDVADYTPCRRQLRRALRRKRR